MQFGRVLGSAVSTVKHATLRGERLLVVQPITADGGDDGDPVLAFDRMGAARGDRVIMTNDGMAMQDLLGKTTPGRWSVLGLPDR